MNSLIIQRRKKAAMLLLTALLLLTSACTSAPLRLHVVANSDSDADQKVKMKVRDAVLELTKEGMQACENAQDAKEYLEENLEIIVATANDTLEKNDMDYTADATVSVSHFPDKEYKGVRYPEGDYEALRVVLGDGNGQNWWCVMFPPLCITELDPNVEEAEYTSFFAELWEGLFGEEEPPPS